MRSGMKTLFPLVLLAASAGNAAAHELQDNRALLVLRDGTHVSVTIYLAYAEALHIELAPVRPFAEFVAVYAAMKPELLQKQLDRAQEDFQAATRVQTAAGTDLALKNWIWPDAKRVQSLLQQIVMQSVTDPGGHFHEEPVEVRADAVAAQEVSQLRVRFPQAFQRVLVVSYRPVQLWVEPNTVSPAIRF